MQKTAQKQKMELDKLVIQRRHSQDGRANRHSCTRRRIRVRAVYGGARWNWNAGVMEECLPREMSWRCAAVVVCRAVLADKLEKNGSVSMPVL